MILKFVQEKRCSLSNRVKDEFDENADGTTRDVTVFSGERLSSITKTPSAQPQITDHEITWG